MTIGYIELCSKLLKFEHLFFFEILKLLKFEIIEIIELFEMIEMFEML